VVKALAAQPAACRLLLGDLNVPGRAAAVATRWRRLADPPTWPAPDPRVQFDHVMADAPLRVTAAAALALEISDHRALVVELPDL
jgi:endonuclease/exonuclease/phosphatase (EEP) superfamily protein YafD